MSQCPRELKRLIFDAARQGAARSPARAGVQDRADPIFVGASIASQRTAMQAIRFSIFAAGVLAVVMLGACGQGTTEGCRCAQPVEDWPPRGNGEPDAGDRSIIVPPRDATEIEASDEGADEGDDDDPDGSDE
jgi:hypothetical protein